MGQPPLARLRAFGEDTRAALRESPGLRLLLFSTMLSSFIAGLLIPVLPLFLIDRGFSLLQLGGLFSMVAVTSVLVQVLGGRYPQVFARRDTVLALQSLTVVAFPLYLVVATPLEFLAVTALSSFAAAASAPGLQVLLAHAAPVTRRATLFSYFGLIASLSYAAAVVVGFGLSTRGYAAVLYLGTVASLLSFLVAAWVLAGAHLLGRPGLRGWAPERRAAFAQGDAALREARAWAHDLARARGGLEALLPRPRQAARNVRWLTLHLFFFGLSVAVYPVYFPIHLAQLGLDRAWGGVVIAASWVTFGLCQPLGGRWADRTGRFRELIVATLVVAAALNFVMATGPLAWVVVAWVLLGIADGLGRPVTSALVAASVTRAGRAGAFAWTAAGTTAARVVAPYALALAIAGGGVDQGLLLVTVTILLAALPVAMVRGLREPGTPPRARPPAVPGGVP